jgi:hypothetical protein
MLWSAPILRRPLGVVTDDQLDNLLDIFCRYGVRYPHYIPHKLRFLRSGTTKPIIVRYILR